MQIGEFAVLCETKISVLRHYDKEGLLKPDYIDAFTGYRYYSTEQADDFKKISALKAAGFSLPEIRELLAKKTSREEIAELFDKKQSQLNSTLRNLTEAKELLRERLPEPSVSYSEDENGLSLSVACSDVGSFDEKCRFLELWLSGEDLQRITPFKLSSLPEGGYSVSCMAVRLLPKLRPLYENIDLPFEDDPQVVGKWEAIGEFAVREDFFQANRSEKWPMRRSVDIIYFLSGGENYWSFSWTRGYLFIQSSKGESSINSYTVEAVGNQLYMFVDLKSYNYRRGGRTTVLVLRRLDNISYKKQDIARRDNVDMPFENDPSVLGKWRAVDFVWEKESFDPLCRQCTDMFFCSVHFFEGGEVKSCFSNGGEIFGKRLQEWTRGYLNRKYDNCSCAYEIRNVGGRDYLFMEWKSGDWIFGGMDMNYYVFEREI